MTSLNGTTRLVKTTTPGGAVSAINRGGGEGQRCRKKADLTVSMLPVRVKIEPNLLTDGAETAAKIAFELSGKLSVDLGARTG
jgi:hypothetical protein